MLSSGYMLRAEYNAMADFVHDIAAIRELPIPTSPRSE
jgi:hypothetical protein